MSSSDVSSVVNFFATVNEGFATTLSGSISANATSVPLTSVVGLTNGTIFVGIVDPGQSAQQTFTGTVDTGGSQITNVVWTRGINVGHAGGASVVDYVSGTGHNMMTKGILVEHGQTGAHDTTKVMMLAGSQTVSGQKTFSVAPLLPANTVETADLQDGAVSFVKLLSTVFSGQVASFSNAGSAGGTFYYINLGGVKLLWGVTGSISVSTGNNSAALTLPVGFFSTIQAVTATPNSVSGTALITSNIQGATTTSVTVGAFSTVGSGSATVAVFVIGT